MSNFDEKVGPNCHIAHLDNFFGEREYGYQAVTFDKFGIHPVKNKSKVFRSRAKALSWLQKNDTEMREFAGLSKGRL